MARIFITGSSDGLGALAAQRLISQGHTVVLHARNAQRAKDAQSRCPGASAVLTADLSSISETKRLAAEANALGRFDAVIHNAGIGYQEPCVTTEDGIARVFVVNSLAPYILTCLMERPKRLVYISSGLHQSGDPTLRDLTWEQRGKRGWNGFQAYSDSKLHNILLAFGVVRRWKDVCSNALEPGWVATKMGGPSAPDDMEKAVETQVWLATGEDEKARVSGRYWYHGREKQCSAAARDQRKQDQFLEECRRISGEDIPA